MLALVILGHFPKWKISKNLIYDFMLAICLVNDDVNDTDLQGLLILTAEKKVQYCFFVNSLLDQNLTRNDITFPQSTSTQS